MQVLFPEGTTLRKLAQYFKSQQGSDYQQLAEIMLKRMEEHYGHKFTP